MIPRRVLRSSRFLSRCGVFLAAAALAAPAALAARAPGRTNPRIANHPSPYVRAAARQPVDWWPFGPAAFAEAKRLGKPVLLDIGAVWCHWCHVMDRESYDNPEVAEAINRYVVPVKVDRDARPDVDRRYQLISQAISGWGGWPLTVFLTPGGHVIYATGYVPPKDRGGRPGMVTLVRRVAEIYKEKGEKLIQDARSAHREIARLDREMHKPGILDTGLIAAIRRAALRQHGPGGGFDIGVASRFPKGAAIELLLEAEGAPEMRAAALDVLRTIARSALRDQIGGGFHRYTVDPGWKVPHFEKVAYVQAELIRAFARAYALSGKGEFRRAALEAVAYLDREGSDRAWGGFYASQDADVGVADDGSYFTWTLDEVRRLLTPAEAGAAIARFGVAEAPGVLRGRPAENVLFLARTLSKVARGTRRSLAETRRLLLSAKGKLRAARRGRKSPAWDRSLYVGWNGMLASAYFDAARYLGCEGCRAFALRTVNRLLAEAVDPRKGVAHEIPPKPRSRHNVLEDYAWAATALLDAFEETGEGRYREGARTVLSLARRKLWEESRGGFVDNRPEAWLEGMQFNTRILEDVAGPSPQAVVAEALLRLAAATGEEKYRRWAGAHLRSGAGVSTSLGSILGAFGRTAELYLEGPVTVVLLGGGKTLAKLRSRALSTFRPRRIVLTVREGDPTEGLPEAVQGMMKQYNAGVFGEAAEAVAFVCAGRVCAFPTPDADKMVDLIANFSRRLNSRPLPSLGPPPSGPAAAPGEQAG